MDTFFLELEGELRVEETVTKVRALTLKNTRLSGDVAVTIGGKVRINMFGSARGVVRLAAKNRSSSLHQLCFLVDITPLFATTWVRPCD